MKKNKLGLLAIFVAMSLILVSCGGDRTETTTVAPTTTSEEVQESSSEKVTETTTKVVEGEGETLSLKLLNAVYDPEVWIVDEDMLYDDDNYALAELCIMSEAGSDETLSVSISVSVESAKGFRNTLHNYEFDLYEYAVNKSYDLVNIAGIDCVKSEKEQWGMPAVTYIGRDEAKNTTLTVSIVGDDPSAADQLLQSMKVLSEDIGNVDAPWPWDGEPFAVENMSAMAGAVTLESQMIPVNEPLTTFDIFEQDIAFVGEKAYIVCDTKLYEYDYDGEALTFVKEIELDQDVNKISATEDGSIWLSAFMQPLLQVKDGEVVASYKDVDYVVMHPSGTWGINYFTSGECEKLSFADGVMSKEAIDFSAQTNLIQTLIIDQNHIYIAGSDVSNDQHKVFVYDTEGQLQMTLNDAEDSGLGSITFIAETENGFIGFDGNMREVCLWTADGQWMDYADHSDLFGTSYPWFCSGDQLSTGEVIVMLVEERADHSADEVVIFKLSGF